MSKDQIHVTTESYVGPLPPPHILQKHQSSRAAELKAKQRAQRIYVTWAFFACVLNVLSIIAYVDPAVFETITASKLKMVLALCAMLSLWAAILKSIEFKSKVGGFIDIDNAVSMDSKTHSAIHTVNNPFPGPLASGAQGPQRHNVPHGANGPQSPAAVKAASLAAVISAAAKATVSAKAVADAKVTKGSSENSASSDPLESTVPGSEELHLPVDRFERYMYEVVASFDKQITLAERKASTLLDKGTSYIRNGIIFYVGSLIAWQILGRDGALTPILIVGMVSCSLTFLVIEFLAAWFLRQYRSFVDASTHLVRVKSLFHRYMLSYFGMKEFYQEDMASLEKMRIQLVEMLSVEIKWPEPVVGKNGDFNHMMEMFDSMTKFMDKAKGVVRGETSGKPD